MSASLVTAETQARTGAETLAGRGEVRGVVSPSASFVAAASSGNSYDINDKYPAAPVVAGDASAVLDAAARRNTLTMNGGSRLSLTGGQTGTGEAVGNKVIMTGGITTQIWGALTKSGILRGNTVEIHGGSMNLFTGYGTVPGAYGQESTLAEGNTVTITGGTIDKEIYGAQRDTTLDFGVVKDNHVVISGGEVGISTYGGVVVNGDAYGNSVSLSGTGVAKTLIGGVAENLEHFNFEML